MRRATAGRVRMAADRVSFMDGLVSGRGDPLKRGNEGVN
jgi:hypothetical protein